MKRDDFKEFAVKLRGKNNNYRQMKKVLGEIKAEVNVLNRTEAILKGKASNLDEFYKNLEKEHGVEGYGNVAEKMEGLAENQQKMDSQKDETLQEITKIVTEIEGQIKQKKQQLAPEIKELRSLRNKHQELEQHYNEKKKTYDNTVSNLDLEKNRLEEDVTQLFSDYKNHESKFHMQNIQEDIQEAFQKRINNESKFLNQPDKRFSPEFKSYTDFFQTKLRQQENVLRDMKDHQRHIKDNAHHYQRQGDLFKNLTQILEIKKRITIHGGGDGLVGRQDNNAAGFDRFVLE